MEHFALLLQSESLTPSPFREERDFPWCPLLDRNSKEETPEHELLWWRMDRESQEVALEHVEDSVGSKKALTSFQNIRQWVNFFYSINSYSQGDVK